MTNARSNAIKYFIGDFCFFVLFFFVEYNLRVFIDIYFDSRLSQKDKKLRYGKLNDRSDDRKISC